MLPRPQDFGGKEIAPNKALFEHYSDLKEFWVAHRLATSSYIRLPSSSEVQHWIEANCDDQWFVLAYNTQEV